MPPEWNKTQYILHHFLVLQYQMVLRCFPAFLPVDPFGERVKGVPERVLGQLPPPEVPQSELLSFDEFCILTFFSSDVLFATK